MKLKNILLCVALATVSAASAQDVMKITFTDATSTTYDVDAISEITFEGTSTPVVPPTPGEKVLVTRINDMTYTYDSEGRCTSFFDGDVIMEFNYSTMKFSMEGYELGSFSLTPEGYLKSLYMNFMGASNTVDIKYDENGRMVEQKATYDYGGGESGWSVNTFVWNNNVIDHVVSEGIEEGDEFAETLEYKYSDTPNALGQWTLAMGDIEADFQLSVTGMYGVAPALFPCWCKWSTDSPDDISYTFNTNGTVSTEKFRSKTYTYSYGAQQKAPRKKGKLNKFIERVKAARNAE